MKQAETDAFLADASVVSRNVVGGDVSKKALMQIRAHARESERPWFVLSCGTGGVLAAFEDRLILIKIDGTPTRPDTLNRHSILSKSARFVRTNTGRTSKGFHCRQATDDSVATGHSPNANRQCDRRRDRKSFRNCRDRERDGHEEHVGGRLPTE